MSPINLLRPRCVEVSPYTLTAKAGQAVGRHVGPGRTRHGVLLRIHWRDLPVPGHADLHPWPELGDEPLERQVAALVGADWIRAQLPSNLARTVFFARLDADAVARGVSLFAGHPAIENHWLVTSLQSFRAEEILHAVTRGFRCFKIKVGATSPAEEAAALRQLVALLPPDHRVRLDFNGKYVAAQDFLEGWPFYAKALGNRLDWIEDPLDTFDPETWCSLQELLAVRFALDRNGAAEFARAAVHRRDNAVHTWILKPAVQDEQPLLGALRGQSAGARVCVTSYLDHPLGQLTALWVAGELARVDSIQLEVCGLASQNAYVESRFSQLLTMRGPSIDPPAGLGWGWTDELASLEWERIG